VNDYIEKVMPNTVFNALTRQKSETTHLPAVRTSSHDGLNKSARIRVRSTNKNPGLLKYSGVFYPPQSWLVSRLWRSEINDRCMSIDDIENTKVIGLEGNELQAILTPSPPVNPDVCLLTDSPFRILRVS
jgi:hypothetical protein